MNNSNHSYFLPKWAVCVFLKARDNFSLVFTQKTVCISSAKSSPSMVMRRQTHTSKDTHEDVCMHRCTSKCTHTRDACICTYNTCSLANMGTWVCAHIVTRYQGFLKDLLSWRDQSFVGFCFLLILVV